MKYPTDPKLREALIDHRTTHELTNKKFATILGVTETFISKYLNDKLDRNPKNFDAEAWDALKSIKRRLEMARELFPTNVTREMHGRFNYIRATGNIGLFHGPAGTGKTSSTLLYIESNPSCPYINLNARTRTGRDVEAATFSSVESREWKANTSRWDWLVNHFKGSHRTIFYDNAQRLTGNGHDWIFDFHDATGCPIVEIGNPETLDKIKAVDQRSSRMGPSYAVGLTDSEVAKHAHRVAIQFSNEETADEIADLVAIIGKNEGHLRSVRQEVVLMNEFMKMQSSLKDDPRKALRMAHNELVRNYSLPA